MSAIEGSRGFGHFPHLSTTRRSSSTFALFADKHSQFVDTDTKEDSSAGSQHLPTSVQDTTVLCVKGNPTEYTTKSPDTPEPVGPHTNLYHKGYPIHTVKMSDQLREVLAAFWHQMQCKPVPVLPADSPNATSSETGGAKSFSAERTDASQTEDAYTPPCIGLLKTQLSATADGRPLHMDLSCTFGSVTQSDVLCPIMVASNILRACHCTQSHSE